MKLNDYSPGTVEDNKTQVIESENDGSITVLNFPVTRTEKITIKFRGLTAADDGWIQKTLKNSDDELSDWRILARICIQWGTDTTATTAEFISSNMPYSSSLFLRSEVLPLIFRSIETS